MPRKTFTYDGRRHSVSAKTESELAVKVAMKKHDLDEGKKRIANIYTHVTDEMLKNAHAAINAYAASKNIPCATPCAS